MNIAIYLSLFLFSVGFFMSSHAFAYIGPGVGAGAVVLTIGILLGVLLLFVGLIWYPLKRALKGKKAQAKKPEDLDQAK